jgi:hypothetical protein
MADLKTSWKYPLTLVDYRNLTWKMTKLCPSKKTIIVCLVMEILLRLCNNVTTVIKKQLRDRYSKVGSPRYVPVVGNQPWPRFVRKDLIHFRRKINSFVIKDCSFPTSSGWSKTQFDNHVHCLSFAAYLHLHMYSTRYGTYFD